MRRSIGNVSIMEPIPAPQTPLPAGFHWETGGFGAARHCIVVPDVAPEMWLASIGSSDSGCTATIRRHQARAQHINRPFRTEAAAAGWVARWLDRQGYLIQAELQGEVIHAAT